MRFERIATTNHPLYTKAMDLYNISFPYIERRDEEAQKAIMQKKDYRFQAICDEETFVGVLMYWVTDHYIFAEHFCILPEMRNKKYGHRALDLLKQYGKDIILEIELPLDSISIRRKGFYERAGFQLNDFEHYQLVFHEDDPKLPLAIMTWPEKISSKQYQKFSEYLDHVIMAKD